MLNEMPCVPICASELKIGEMRACGASSTVVQSLASCSAVGRLFGPERGLRWERSRRKGDSKVFEKRPALRKQTVRFPISGSTTTRTHASAARKTKETMSAQESMSCVPSSPFYPAFQRALRVWSANTRCLARDDRGNVGDSQRRRHGRRCMTPAGGMDAVATKVKGERRRK